MNKISLLIIGLLCFNKSVSQISLAPEEGKPDILIFNDSFPDELEIIKSNANKVDVLLAKGGFFEKTVSKDSKQFMPLVKNFEKNFKTNNFYASAYSAVLQFLLARTDYIYTENKYKNVKSTLEKLNNIGLINLELINFILKNSKANIPLKIKKEIASNAIKNVNSIGFDKPDHSNLPEEILVVLKEREKKHDMALEELKTYL